MAEPCGGEVELHMFGCAQRVGANPMRSPVPIARNTVDLMEVADSSARLALEHQFANDKRSLPGDVKGLRAETVVNGQSGKCNELTGRRFTHCGRATVDFRRKADSSARLARDVLVRK